MTASSKEGLPTIKVLGYSIDFSWEIGRGGFGTVYKGSDDDGRSIAIKKVSKYNRNNASMEAANNYFFRGKFLHENIIKVFDVKTWEDSIWIVMEYCDFGDLQDFFRKYYHSIDIYFKLNIMEQISKGVAFLHKKNIVHRDIKPGNILLKSKNDHVIVKLGDFGLSKFLDSNNITSAMSENVGTLMFKAPEFWDRKPDGRVLYHRDVDIYAAGLTFTAMLQAKPGHNLVPKAEDFLQSSETKMPIGFAALIRCQDKQSKIRVVVKNSKDTPLVRNLKDIIEAMTHCSPESRIAAAEVEERIEVLRRELAEPGEQPNLNSCLFSSRAFNLTTMCYTTNSLIVTTYNPETCNSQTKVFNETGNLLKEWEPCHVFHSIMGFEIQGKEYLLEGCTSCKVIRGYLIPQVEWEILRRGISPDLICRGPENTILVFNREEKTISQLHYSSGIFHLAKQFSVEFENIRGFCYSNRCDLILHINSKTITAMYLSTGEVAWQETKTYFSSSSWALNIFQDILTIPNGEICIFTYNEIFTLNPTDGTILERLLDHIPYTEPGVIWAVTTTQNGNQKKLAIAFDTEICVCEIPFQQSKGFRHLSFRYR